MARIVRYMESACWHFCSALENLQNATIMACTLGKTDSDFLGCGAVATLIELAVSYLLEWTTGSWPWQTYADYAINFQARVALSPSVRFGIGGVLFLYLLRPLFAKITGLMSEKVLHVVSITAAVIMGLDLICTVLFKLFL